MQFSYCIFTLNSVLFSQLITTQCRLNMGNKNLKQIQQTFFCRTRLQCHKAMSVFRFWSRASSCLCFHVEKDRDVKHVLWNHTLCLFNSWKKKIAQIGTCNCCVMCRQTGLIWFEVKGQCHSMVLWERLVKDCACQIWLLKACLNSFKHFSLSMHLLPQMNVMLDFI